MFSYSEFPILSYLCILPHEHVCGFCCDSHLLNVNVCLYCLTASWFWTEATTALSLQSNLAGSPSTFCPAKIGALSALARRYRSVDYKTQRPWTQRCLLKIRAAEIEPRSFNERRESAGSTPLWADLQEVGTFYLIINT